MHRVQKGYEAIDYILAHQRGSKAAMNHCPCCRLTGPQPSHGFLFHCVWTKIWSEFQGEGISTHCQKMIVNCVAVFTVNLLNVAVLKSSSSPILGLSVAMCIIMCVWWRCLKYYVLGGRIVLRTWPPIKFEDIWLQHAQGVSGRWACGYSLHFTWNFIAVHSLHTFQMLDNQVLGFSPNLLFVGVLRGEVHL